MDSIYKALAEELKKSNYTVVMTGAGMSTESGIADFRSRDGIWKKYDPMKVATVNALENDYDNFHGFYSMRDEARIQRKPHKGHHILAEWEDKGLISSIITQNVDNFHHQAGSRNVFEIHGSIDKFRCKDCGEPSDRESFLGKEPCPECGGKIRPGIVLFGEPLPEKELYGALEEVKKAELVIIIGTSLTVYPAASIHSNTDGRIIYINDEYDGHKKFDMVIEGKVGEILSEVDKFL